MLAFVTSCDGDVMLDPKTSCEGEGGGGKNYLQVNCRVLERSWEAKLTIGEESMGKVNCWRGVDGRSWQVKSIVHYQSITKSIARQHLASKLDDCKRAATLVCRLVKRTRFVSNMVICMLSFKLIWHQKHMWGLGFDLNTTSLVFDDAGNNGAIWLISTLDCVSHEVIVGGQLYRLSHPQRNHPKLHLEMSATHRRT